MQVKLKDIKGLMVNKRTIRHGDFTEFENDDLTVPAFNEAITQQGLRTITLDLEKTAKRLHKMYYTIFMLPSEWEDLMDFRQEMFLEQADALIAHLPELLIKGE
jgi:hypothetical protein